MLVDEVHEEKRMVGIGHSERIIAKSQPADPAVVVLDEFPVRLLALFFAKGEGLAGSASDASLLFQVFEIVGGAVRPSAIGPTNGLNLQNAEIDAHLNDLPAIGGLDQPRLHYTRLIIPTSKGPVDILLHGTCSANE